MWPKECDNPDSLLPQIYHKLQHYLKVLLCCSFKMFSRRTLFQHGNVLVHNAMPMKIWFAKADVEELQSLLGALISTVLWLIGMSIVNQNLPPKIRTQPH